MGELILQSGKINVTVKTPSININKQKHKVEFITETDDEFVYLILDDEYINKKTFFLPKGKYDYYCYKKNYGEKYGEFEVINEPLIINTNLEKNMRSIILNLENIPKPIDDEILELRVVDEERDTKILINKNINKKVEINDLNLDKTYSVEFYLDSEFKNYFDIVRSTMKFTVTEEENNYNINMDIDRERYYKFLFNVEAQEMDQDNDLNETFASVFELNGLFFEPFQMSEDVLLCAFHNKYGIVEYPLLKDKDGIRIISKYYNSLNEVKNELDDVFIIDKDRKIQTIVFKSDYYFLNILVPYNGIQVFWKYNNEADDKYVELAGSLLFMDGEYDFKFVKYGFEDYYIKNYALTFEKRTLKVEDMTQITAEVYIRFDESLNIKNKLDTQHIVLTVYDNNDIIYQKGFPTSMMKGDTLVVSDFPKGRGMRLYLEVTYYKDFKDNDVETIENVFGSPDNIDPDNYPVKYVIERYITVEENQDIIDIYPDKMMVGAPVVGQVYCFNSLLNLTEEDYKKMEFYIYKDDIINEKVECKSFYKDNILKFVLMVDDEMEYIWYGDDTWRPRFGFRVLHNKKYIDICYIVAEFKYEPYFIHMILKEKNHVVIFENYKPKYKIKYREKPDETYKTFDMENTVLEYKKYDFMVIKPNNIKLQYNVDLSLNDNFNNTIVIE